MSTTILSHIKTRKELFIYFFEKKVSEGANEEDAITYSNRMCDIVCENTGMDKKEVSKDAMYWVEKISGMKPDELAAKYGPQLVEYGISFVGGFFAAKGVEKIEDKRELVEHLEEEEWPDET